MAEREVAAAMGGDVAAPDLRFSDRPNLVFLDLESCPFPKDLKGADILPRIISRLSEWGYSGPVQMLAVGGYRSFPARKMVDSGILVRHTRPGKSIVRMVCVMLPWVKSNPAPANLLLIARDRELPSIIEALHKDNYNVLQRQQESTTPGIEDDVSYCWSWSEVFDGGRPQGNFKRSTDSDGP